MSPASEKILNNATLICDIADLQAADIELPAPLTEAPTMVKRVLISLIFVLAAAAAQADCYADYKAKKDGPLRLHYGVIQLDGTACRSPSAAVASVQSRIARDGWTLLNVMSIFDQSGLNQRRKSAGAFFLRF